MHPIKEYDLTTINKSLALEFIKIHNLIYEDVLEINAKAQGVSSKKYLDIFISNFSRLDEKNEKLVVQTIICAPKKRLNDIFDDCSKVNVRSAELILSSQLTSINYYKDLQKKEAELLGKAPLTPAQNKRLQNIQKELAASTKLKPLLLKVFDYTGRRKNLLQYYALMDYRVCISTILIFLIMLKLLNQL